MGGSCCDERCGDDIGKSERTSDGFVLHNGNRFMVDHLYHVIFCVFKGGHLDHFVLLPHNYGLLLVNTVRSALDQDWLCLLDVGYRFDHFCNVKLIFCALDEFAVSGGGDCLAGDGVHCLCSDALL